jgi:hypothetical protein
MDEYAQKMAASQMAQQQAGYGLGSLSSANIQRSPKMLDKLGIAADRVARVNESVAAMLDRFNGPQPQTTASGARLGDTISVSYRDSVERLFAAIETLEVQTSQLADLA